MIFLSGATNDAVEARLLALGVGLMVQPRTKGYLDRVGRYPAFAADNDCFNRGDCFDAEAWFAWLATVPPAGCLFATAPDVVGDAAATLVRSRPWLARIRSLGLPAAYVGQDGATVESLPWDDFDVLFIGGSTAWKLGAEAASLVAEAKRRGMWVHMGRVNTRRRMIYAASIGCDSVDGTLLAFGPDAGVDHLEQWLPALAASTQLALGAVA